MLATRYSHRLSIGGIEGRMRKLHCPVIRNPFLQLAYGSGANADIHISLGQLFL